MANPAKLSKVLPAHLVVQERFEFATKACWEGGTVKKITNQLETTLEEFNNFNITNYYPTPTVMGHIYEVAFINHVVLKGNFFCPECNQNDQFGAPLKINSTMV